MTDNESRGHRCRFSPHDGPKELQRPQQQQRPSCWDRRSKRSGLWGVGRHRRRRRSLGRPEGRSPVLRLPGRRNAVAAQVRAWPVVLSRRGRILGADRVVVRVCYFDGANKHSPSTAEFQVRFPAAKPLTQQHNEKCSQV